MNFELLPLKPETVQQLDGFAKREDFVEGDALWWREAGMKLLQRSPVEKGHGKLGRRRVEIMRPFALQPPQVSRRQAEEELRGLAKGAFLAPPAIRQGLLDRRNLHGVFLPFWIFDCTASTRYRGKWRTGRGASWRRASGTLKRRFCDIVVPAGALAQEVLPSLAPLDLTRLAPFNWSHYSGFEIERYEKDWREAFKEAARKIHPAIERDALEALPGEGRIKRLDTRHDEVAFKLLLLPVWMCAFQHGEDEIFRAAIDAQTGRLVAPSLPRSLKRIALLAATALAAAFLIIWLAA